ncbi:MAG: protoheme IX farnesyltransferase [Deltaproteobacteria bacterium]|nr:protoheme IX farnesyltransferase [Deltaproteobacteria bacterium]
MIPQPRAIDVDASRLLKRAADFVSLGKPRVVSMVLLTTAAGFYLGSQGFVNYVLLLPALLGTGLAASGTLALNQYMERDVDALMQRTRQRPLPDGRLQPTEALLYGAFLTLAGLVYLALAVNPLCALVTAATTLTYLFLYTPLKRLSPFCTVVGAVPGALPPVTGWTAARGDVHFEAWILFAILFLWQLPHSLAIARLYREDYARGGIRLLPVVEPDARSTGIQAVANTLALLVVGLLPTAIGMSGGIYFLAALALGLAFLWYAVAFAWMRTIPSARQLLFASLVYLPVLLLAMTLDKVPHGILLP